MFRALVSLPTLLKSRVADRVRRRVQNWSAVFVSSCLQCDKRMGFHSPPLPGGDDEVSCQLSLDICVFVVLCLQGILDILHSLAWKIVAVRPSDRDSL